MVFALVRTLSQASQSKGFWRPIAMGKGRSCIILHDGRHIDSLSCMQLANLHCKRMIEEGVVCPSSTTCISVA